MERNIICIEISKAKENSISVESLHSLLGLLLKDYRFELIKSSNVNIFYIRYEAEYYSTTLELFTKLKSIVSRHFEADIDRTYLSAGTI